MDNRNTAFNEITDDDVDGMDPNEICEYLSLHGLNTKVRQQRDYVQYNKMAFQFMTNKLDNFQWQSAILESKDCIFC